MHRWTEKEKSLLFTTMTNEQIAKELNMPIKSIGHARRYYTGKYSSPNYYLSKHWEKIDKEARIYDLARKLGVRIEGMR